MIPFSHKCHILNKVNRRIQIYAIFPYPSHSPIPLWHMRHADYVSYRGRFPPLLTLSPPPTEHQYPNLIPQYLTCCHVSLVMGNRNVNAIIP